MTVSLPPVIVVKNNTESLPAVIKINDEVFKVES